jgi:hypothetical protein
LVLGRDGSRLHGCFGAAGPAFRAGKERLSLRLRAWGREGKLEPVVMTRAAAHGNHVEYRGHHLQEWWRVLPIGYEQGFAIQQAPAGHGKIVLQLQASATPSVKDGILAWGSLRYGKLHVVDARGKALPATLRNDGNMISLAFESRGASYPVTVDPVVWVQQSVVSSDGAASDYFGSAVAMSADGTTALVGAYNKNVGVNNYQGEAYVFTNSGGVWSEVARLRSSDGSSWDYFGVALALSSDGSTALVSARYKNVGASLNQGEAYIFTRPVGGWASASPLTEDAVLVQSDPSGSDYFGYSVALSSDGATALLGTVDGGAYVFTKPVGGWVSTPSSPLTQNAKLMSSDYANNDYLGEGVALSGDGATALVGAWCKPYDTLTYHCGSGAAYAFTRPAGGWVSTVASPLNESAKLLPSDGAMDDAFGRPVALSADGTTALIAAAYKTVSTNASQGQVYVFTQPTAVWSSGTDMNETAVLTASDGTTNSFFGWSAALSGDGTTALVGAQGNLIPGEAYILSEPVGGWADTTESASFAGGSGAGLFGFAVALSGAGDVALVGADELTVSSNTKQGGAYFYTAQDLSSSLSAPTSVASNAQFNSTYTIVNNASAASLDIKAALAVPPSNASVVSATTTAGPGCTFDGATSTYVCDLGSIPGGGSVSATVVLKATGTSGSTVDQSANLVDVSPGLVQVASTSITSGGGGGGGGGGGAFSLLSLFALLGFSGASRRKAERMRAPG